MSTAVLRPETSPAEAGLAELTDLLFASLRRRDQRDKGAKYLRGLLTAKGRKSIRNIASVTGGSAAEQSLHHFVSCSPWEWAPMRRALAEYVHKAVEPQAWVVQSVQIPKVGEHSVGVGRHFVPHLGQTVNGQQAFGLWLAGQGVSAPVNWRMYLPGSWLDDSDRRRRAEIPEELPEETLAACAAAVVLEVAGWGLPVRPVVLDARSPQVRGALDTFAALGVPFLARIDPGDRLTVADPALPGYGAGALPAQHIMRSVSGLRRPVRWLDPSAPTPAVRTSLAAAIRVEPAREPSRPAAAEAGRGRMLLLGEWRDPRRPPAELWLTGMGAAPPGALLRLGKLVRRVARDYREVGEPSGLSEFAGRSFHGWHRHVTLASAAHAAALLGERR
ncbi:IS701 family transposase [Streptomyces sp. NPDC020490]|uniref:IS701 family transposase n=1 Tax=Streptomyces sp. NPDC020490 TaxID=3365078 RepID=UPI0037A005CE